jgi:hypothetical protein
MNTDHRDEIIKRILARIEKNISEQNDINTVFTKQISIKSCRQQIN